MSHHKHNDELKKLICQQMGEDIDAPVCDEIINHLEECPECKVHFDSVKNVVKIYRITEEEKDVPEDVSQRLFKVLNLKDK